MEVPDKKGRSSMPGTAWLRRISAVSRMTGAAGAFPAENTEGTDGRLSMANYFEDFDFTDFWEDSGYAKEKYTEEAPSDELIASVEQELEIGRASCRERV